MIGTVLSTGPNNHLIIHHIQMEDWNTIEDLWRGGGGVPKGTVYYTVHIISCIKRLVNLAQLARAFDSQSKGTESEPKKSQAMFVSERGPLT